MRIGLTFQLCKNAETHVRPCFCLLEASLFLPVGSVTDAVHTIRPFVTILLQPRPSTTMHQAYTWSRRHAAWHARIHSLHESITVLQKAGAQFMPLYTSGHMAMVSGLYVYMCNSKQGDCYTWATHIQCSWLISLWLWGLIFSSFSVLHTLVLMLT